MIDVSNNIIMQVDKHTHTHIINRFLLIPRFVYINKLREKIKKNKK